MLVVRADEVRELNEQLSERERRVHDLSAQIKRLETEKQELQVFSDACGNFTEFCRHGTFVEMIFTETFTASRQNVTRAIVCVRDMLHVVDAAHIVCGAESRVSVCLSNRSTAAVAGGFAAERLAGRRYRSTAAGTGAAYSFRRAQQ